MIPRLFRLLSRVAPMLAGYAVAFADFHTERDLVIAEALTVFADKVDVMKGRFPELAAWDEPTNRARGKDWLFYDAGEEEDGRTPGAGLYLRIFVQEEPGTSGDRGKRFPVKLSGGLYLGVNGSLHVRGDGALSDALSKAYQEVRAEVLKPGLARALLGEAGVPADVSARLAAAELGAGGGRWADEVVAAVPYQRTFRSTIGSVVFDVLAGPGEVLGGERLHAVWMALCERRYPVDAWGGAVDLLRSRDAENWPARSTEVVRMLIEAEEHGLDRFEATPFFGAPWSSTVRDLRWRIANEIMASSDARFSETVALFLQEDPSPANRVGVMKWLASTESPERACLVREALANEYRGVVVLAAGLAADHSDERTKEALRRLAVSPVVRVREAATAALRRLGESAPAPTDEFPLPAEAVKLVRTLNELGLDDATMIRVFSNPDVISAPRRNAAGEAEWERLEDPWRLSRLDQPSVARRAGQYAARFGLERTFCRIDPTGSYLLVAAERLGSPSLLSVYRTMGEEFESDQVALQRGVDYLAWTVFLGGLDAFQCGRDDTARQAFERMERFAGYATPHSRLSVWLGQSRALLAELGRRRSLPIDEPEPTDLQAAIAYWIERIPEINGLQNEQPALPSIWARENRPWRDYQPRLPFASDRLRAMGRAALPALVDCIGDDTPTRTIGYHRDFFPDRHWVTKGKAAEEIIRVICQDEGIEPPYDWRVGYRGHPARLAGVWREWLKNVGASHRETPHNGH